MLTGLDRLLNRADIVPDAGMIASLSLILPLVEADMLALLCDERDTAALWHSSGPGFVQSCITRLQAGAHRGAAVQPRAAEAPAAAMEGLTNA